MSGSYGFNHLQKVSKVPKQTSRAAGRLRCTWRWRWFRTVTEESQDCLIFNLFFCTLCSWHTGTPWTWVSDSPRKLLMKQFRCFDNPRHFLSSTFEFTSKQNLSRSTSTCSEVALSTCRKVWPFEAFKAAFLLLHAYDWSLYVHHTVNLMHPVWNSRSRLSGKPKHSSACPTSSFYKSTFASKKEAFNCMHPQPLFFVLLPFLFFISLSIFVHVNTSSL